MHDNIAFVDEQTVVYPAGQYLISTNVETHTQKFIPAEAGSCMAIHPTTKLACTSVEMENDSGFALHLIDLAATKKRKTITDTQVNIN